MRYRITVVADMVTLNVDVSPSLPITEVQTAISLHPYPYFS
jgi:hypothetical protein